MTIRPATRDDATPVAALHTASWRIAYADLLPAEFLAGPVADDHLTLWRERLAAPAAGAALFVAEDQDGLGGFVYLRPGTGDRILLDNLHVRPDGKRRGLGSALFAHALDWTRDTAPGRDLYLEVLTGNTGAIAFYERLGGHRTREGVAVFPQGFEVPEYEYAWPAG